MNVEMWVEKAIDDFMYWYNIYENDGTFYGNQGYQTREEAQRAAIKKLDDLINER